MLYTIGHSVLSQEDFIKAIVPVKIISDTRSHPNSHMEQWRIENLRNWLPEYGKTYEWEPALGGWRSKHKDLPTDFKEQLALHGVDYMVYTTSAFPKQRIAKKRNMQGWQNWGLYDYSWFMTLPEFIEAAEHLIARGLREDIAIMCCEAVYWRCHRSMISDYVVWRGADIAHLEPHWRQKNKVKFVDGYKHKLHSAVIGDRLSRYDGEIIKRWQTWLNQNT